MWKWFFGGLEPLDRINILEILFTVQITLNYFYVTHKELKSQSDKLRAGKRINDNCLQIFTAWIEWSAVQFIWPNTTKMGHTKLIRAFFDHDIEYVMVHDLKSIYVKLWKISSLKDYLKTLPYLLKNFDGSVHERFWLKLK